MLEDVRQHDRFRVHRQSAHCFQVCDHGLIEAAVKLADAIHLELESDRAIEVIAHRCTQLATRRAKVEKRPPARGEAADQIDEDPMAAPFEVFEGVDVRHRQSKPLRCCRRA